MAKQIWRNSASTILICKRATNNSSTLPLYDRNKLPGKLKKDEHDYRFLLLKRGNESKFMPNVYVFPGGALDEADLTSDWTPILSKLDEKFLTRFILPDNKPRLFQFESPIVNQAGSPNATSSTLPFEVATRICAIRETFEESGILLARKINEISKEEILPFKFGETFSKNDQSLSAWRKRVTADAKNFLLLCKEKGICPDIWALHEWSSWLTPTEFPRRFNTVFYTCFLNNTPEVAIDNQEVSHSQWFSPTEALDHFYALKLVLPPPQNYDIRRFAQIESIEKLAKFCKKRSFEGLDCWLPVLCSTADGTVHVLPGDELYPKEPDYFGERPTISKEKSTGELRKIATAFNRGEGFGEHMFNYKYYCNIKLPYQQLPPICDDENLNRKSKL